MSSTLYAYICTKETADPFIPSVSIDITRLSRDVSDAFAALQGGHRMVGQISLFPVQRAVPSHLLCDGREVAKAAFPELFAYLGTTQGEAASPDNFLLPNFIGGSLTPAETAEPESTNAGTVNTPQPTNPQLPDFDKWGDRDSGGRFNDRNPV